MLDHFRTFGTGTLHFISVCSVIDGYWLWVRQWSLINSN